MTFEQFQTNVQEWSTDRGIYEHSTALAQALKAVSEETIENRVMTHE